jgi:hypothetical protein
MVVVRTLLAVLVLVLVLVFAGAAAANHRPCHRGCATPTPTATPLPTATATPSPAPAPPGDPRGIWAEAHKVTDAELAQIRALGYAFVFSKAETASLDRIAAAGLQAAVWLGKFYDDNDTDGPRCTWQRTDQEITALVTAVRDHPAVAYYFLDDEPHDLCANVRSAFQARDALVKAVDPAHPTFITENRTEAFDSLANVTDILALIGYPCRFGALCSTSNVPGRIAAARAAGVQRYWAVPQLFNETGDGAYYRYPTASEYTAFMLQWRDGGVEGDFAFMWNRVYSSATGLSEAPGLWDAVTASNTR